MRLGIGVGLRSELVLLLLYFRSEGGSFLEMGLAVLHGLRLGLLSCGWGCAFLVALASLRYVEAFPSCGWRSLSTLEARARARGWWWAFVPWGGGFTANLWAMTFLPSLLLPFGWSLPSLSSLGVAACPLLQRVLTFFPSLLSSGIGVLSSLVVGVGLSWPTSLLLVFLLLCMFFSFGMWNM